MSRRGPSRWKRSSLKGRLRLDKSGTLKEKGNHYKMLGVLRVQCGLGRIWVGPGKLWLLETVSLELKQTNSN